MRNLIAGLALGLTVCGAAYAATTDGLDKRGLPNEQYPVYVQIIVKACPAVETVLGPTNQGKIYDDEKSMTREERKAHLLDQGCIDVPIPMEWVNGEMTPKACRGQAGYLASMQFLEQRQDLKGFSSVGAWDCIVTDSQTIGAISQ
jgi:hypothetical protein